MMNTLKLSKLSVVLEAHKEIKTKITNYIKTSQHIKLVQCLAIVLAFYRVLNSVIPLNVPIDNLCRVK